LFREKSDHFAVFSEFPNVTVLFVDWKYFMY